MAVRYVEYIESDGTAYFPTGITPTANTKIEAKAAATDGHCYISSASGTYRFGLYLLTANNIDMGYGSLGYKTSVLKSVSYPAVVTLENGQATANGAIYSFDTQSAFTAGELSLFGVGKSPTGKGRINYFKHWENGVLVHHWRAAKDENGVACFYEEVSKIYEYGTGTFTAGPELAVPAVDFGTVCRMPLRIAKLKDGVNYVEYIEGTGEPCINTGFIANQDTRLVIDGQLLESYANNNFAGGRNTTSNKVFTISTVSDNWRVGYNATSKNTGVTADLNRHIFDADKNVFKVDGTTIYTAEYAAFACSQPIYLFAIKGNSDTPYAGQLRIYSCQIYDNGVLVRDLGPALDLDGTACLYDKVSKTYYYNVGTGTFTAGASISGGGSSGGGAEDTKYAVAMTGDYWLDGNCYITYNGITKTADQTFEVKKGETITVYCYCATYSGSGASWIKLNGVEVARAGSGSDPFMTSYTHTVTSNVTIKSGTGLYTPDGLNGYRYYTAEITTE